MTTALRAFLYLFFALKYLFVLLFETKLVELLVIWIESLIKQIIAILLKAFRAVIYFAMLITLLQNGAAEGAF